MNSRLLISAISIAYFIIISIVIKESFFDSTVVKDISSITVSFCTLIIAILLYDRFNYRKIIFERKLEIVLKLLEKIKSTRIQVSYSNEEQKKMFFGIMSMDSQNINHFKEHSNPKAHILFTVEEMNSYFNEISVFRTNPFMPKEIAESLKFLSITFLESVIKNPIYENENYKLSINKNPSKTVTQLDGWNKTHNDISFENFTNSYLECLTLIEKWIDKHSNFKSELNI